MLVPPNDAAALADALRQRHCRSRRSRATAAMPRARRRRNCRPGARPPSNSPRAIEASHERIFGRLAVRCARRYDLRARNRRRAGGGRRRLFASAVDDDRRSRLRHRRNAARDRRATCRNRSTGSWSTTTSACWRAPARCPHRPAAPRAPMPVDLVRDLEIALDGAVRPDHLFGVARSRLGGMARAPGDRMRGTAAAALCRDYLRRPRYARAVGPVRCRHHRGGQRSSDATTRDSAPR